MFASGTNEPLACLKLVPFTDDGMALMIWISRPVAYISAFKAVEKTLTKPFSPAYSCTYGRPMEACELMLMINPGSVMCGSTSLINCAMKRVLRLITLSISSLVFSTSGTHIAGIVADAPPTLLIRIVILISRNTELTASSRLTDISLASMIRVRVLIP
ncbi:hypothetical protein ABW21_db0203660 [Orbilia brochopaga]|nr:hypothetical protein ABW21_db0203660 [Drechslerella brochopaga]